MDQNGLLTGTREVHVCQGLLIIIREPQVLDNIVLNISLRRDSIAL